MFHVPRSRSSEHYLKRLCGMRLWFRALWLVRNIRQQIIEFTSIRLSMRFVCSSGVYSDRVWVDVGLSSLFLCSTFQILVYRGNSRGEICNHKP
jgi:hypothetical protein